MISFALEESEELLQATVRRLAADLVRPRMREWERAREVPESARRAVHELGLGLVDVPEKIGGAGLGLLAAVVAHEELAWGDPGAAVALVGPHLAASAVSELGDEGQAQRLIARLAESHDALGAVAWSEPIDGTGANRRVDGGFATTAKKVGGGWLLQGSKRHVINGGRADLTIVFAELDGQPEGTAGWDGIAAFAVEGRPETLRSGPRLTTLGLETVWFGSLELDGVLVPDENRLCGRKGEFLPSLRRFLARASLVNAARQVGLSRAAAESALEYTQERTAFGKPVAHFQAIAFTLADMAIDVDSARWLVWRAAVEIDQGRGDSPEAQRLVAEAAAQANEVGFRVADAAVQLLGGAGYIQDFPTEKWLRDTKTLALCAPPTSHAQLAAAATFLNLADLDAAGASFPAPSLQPMFT